MGRGALPIGAVSSGGTSGDDRAELSIGLRRPMGVGADVSGVLAGCLPLSAENLYGGVTFASAVRPFGPAGGTTWIVTFDQPVPGVGGRCVQDLSWDSHLPASLISLAGGSFPPANEDIVKRGSR